MQYLGGKSRLVKHIVPIIESHRAPGQVYLEPFVGGGSIICAVSDHGPRIACDLNEALITMWRALQDGWEPPEELDEGEWGWIKALGDPRDPLTAFAATACSFGGMWSGVYARDPKGGRNFAASGKSVLLKQKSKMIGVTFHHCSYLDLRPSGVIIYCDPPYKDTAGYKVTGAFDSELFWQTMSFWAQHNIVFVSEYSIPDRSNIEELWSKEGRITASHRNTVTRIERLYRVHP